MTIEVGTTIGELSVRLAREQLVRYAGASTDFNPIHWSDRAAAELGLDGVIAHGMLTMGMALRVVGDRVSNPEAIQSYSARFTRPVVVPDDEVGVDLRFVGVVSRVGDDTVTVTIEVTSGGEKVLGAVVAEVSKEALT